MQRAMLAQRTMRLFGVATCALLLAGCWGPSHVPVLSHLSHDKIVRTHAKPPLHGYYENFDDDAYRIGVAPRELVAPVHTQVVLVASVAECDGELLEGRRVEWILNRGGVGELVEVDESGCSAGRGYKVDNYYGVSHTNCKDHCLTRGTPDPRDDIPLLEGQTWAVVTSPVEGDTYATVYAPSVYNWDFHKDLAVIHWVDATWQFPASAANPAGTPHVFTTRVHRHSDGSPLKGWLVRYRVVDGPAALFRPGDTDNVEVPTNHLGEASAELVQETAQPGTNRIAVEIVRPGDLYGTGGRELVVARGETYKEWGAASLSLSKEGPSTGNVGGELTYTIHVENSGTVDAPDVVVRDPVPAALRFLRSMPEAIQDGDTLVWELGSLLAGQVQTLEVTFEAQESGSITNCATATAADGLEAEDCVVTEVGSAELTIEKRASVTDAYVGESVTFDIVVTNHGSAPATGVVVSDEFDDGLGFEQAAEKMVRLELGTLAPGEERTLPLTLRGMQAGRWRNAAKVTADGGLEASTESWVTFVEPDLSVTKTGPRWRYQGRPAEFNITVTNNGALPLTNVRVVDQLPPETEPVKATEGASVENDTLVWDLGTVAAGESVRLQVELECRGVAQETFNTVSVTADHGIRAEARAPLEIRATPAALVLTVADLTDPVAVDADTTYEIKVRNTGNQAAEQLQIEVSLDGELMPVTAEGPVEFKVEDQGVIFVPVPTLEPQSELVFRVQARAVSPGDVRCKVTMTSSALELPVIEEEATTIYQP